MIIFYEGMEGAGKSCMMAKDLYMHHISTGGEIWVFPGFELYGYEGEVKKDNRFTISEVMQPEQIITLVQDEANYSVIRRRKVVLAIDEVGNFINHHNWYRRITDVIRAIFDQRRKLGIAIAMTGPELRILPPDLERMVHLVVRLVDIHNIDHRYPREVCASVFMQDLRGMVSTPNHRFSYKGRFYYKPIHPYYDTYRVVSATSQFDKYEIVGRHLKVLPDGRIIDMTAPVEIDDLEGNTAYAFRNPKVDIKEKALECIAYFKQQGQTEIPSELFKSVMPGVPLDGRNGLGSILKQLGVSYDRNKKYYDIAEVES